MKTTRIISQILFYITRVLSIGYLLTVFHMIVSILFKLPTFKLLPENRFAILYPFTEKNFLLGSAFTEAYVLEMILGIAYYGIFFLFLSNVFKTFRQKKLFTLQGTKNLKSFYILNLLIAPILFGILATFSIEDLPFIGMIMAHFIIGIFTFFIAAIFQQGLHLQNEQELYI